MNSTTDILLDAGAAAGGATLPLTPMQMLSELPNLMMTREFGIRCAASGTIAAALYLFFGYATHKLWPRSVKRNIYEVSLFADIVLGLISVLSGSPMLQVFGMAHEKWGVSKMYMSVEEQGWAYWVVSIPLYLLLWDSTFYVTHLFLHWEPVYRLSHANHHAFRPPVAWSGIAIDPIETIFSGILPYIVPLFVLPFHIYTVYAINIILVGWATMLHSSCTWHGNWLFIGARDHNVHHSRGKQNSNFGAIFKLWDRAFGTLDTEHVPFWYVSEQGMKPNKVPSREIETPESTITSPPPSKSTTPTTTTAVRQRATSRSRKDAAAAAAPSSSKKK